MTWVKYSSEKGESWVRLLSPGSEDEHDNQLVKDGSVTYRKEMPPADDVMVAFVPTSKIVDDVTGKIGERGKYHVKLSLLSNSDWFAITFKSYSKEEALQIGSSFIGLNQHQSERVWRAKNLGDIRSTKLSW